MDEPLSNLDAKLRSEMRTELIELHKELHSTFVYVTHDQIEAMTMGDHIVVMNEGKIMQEGTPSEIHNNPNSTFVAKFIGDPGMNIVQIDNDFQFGFRPRDVNFNPTVDNQNCIKMIEKISSIENHGSEFVYSLNIQGSHIYVKELSKKMRDLNSEISFSIAKENLFFFDIDGKRITNQKLIEGFYGKLKSNW
jgi:sn-glycerol 3-phosphate transport system ATP-binding protein